jgi:hypothetical protein
MIFLSSRTFGDSSLARYETESRDEAWQSRHYLDRCLVTNIPLGIKEVSFLGAPFTADGIISVLEGHGEISVPIVLQPSSSIPIKSLLSSLHMCTHLFV